MPHDLNKLAHVDPQDAARSLADWYLSKQADIGQYLNPALVGGLGGAAVGGLAGFGSAEGGLRKRLRKAMTGALMGAGTGAGAGLAYGAMRNPPTPLTPTRGMPSFTGPDGKQYQFDQQQIARNPQLINQMAEATAPTAATTALNATGSVLGTALDVAPATTLGTPALLAARRLLFPKLHDLSKAKDVASPDAAGISHRHFTEAARTKAVNDAMDAARKDFKVDIGGASPDSLGKAHKDILNRMRAQAQRFREEAQAIRSHPPGTDTAKITDDWINKVKKDNNWSGAEIRRNRLAEWLGRRTSRPLFGAKQKLVNTSATSRLGRLGRAALPMLGLDGLLWLYRGLRDTSEQDRKLQEVIQSHAVQAGRR